MRLKPSCVAAVLGLLSLGAASPKPEILVFGAASLTDALQDLGSAFEAKTGQRVQFSFGSSSDLARQIAAGAPADVFFSADTGKMDSLEKAGLVKREDRREFLSNTLVVVVPASSPLEIDSTADLLKVPRIALADPEAVPAGIYAKKWLTGLGLWDKIEPRIVPTLDVRAALTAVEGGTIPAAIVYRTDAAIGKRIRIAYEVTNGPEILYSLAPLGAGKHSEAARAFVRFLASGQGRAEFRERGFLVRGAK